MSDTPLPISDLVPVTEPEMILRHLANGIYYQAPTVFWTQGQTTLMRSKMTTLDKSKNIFSITPESLKSPPQEQKEYIFNVALPAAQLFFKTHCHQVRADQLDFKIPMPIYEAQRRKNVRYRIPDDSSISLNFENPIHPTPLQNKKISDLSAGGLSFMTSQDEIKYYLVGTTLKNITFTLRQKQITSHAEVKQARVLEQLPKNQNLKIGLAFVDLPVMEQDRIASYIITEAARHLPKENV